MGLRAPVLVTLALADFAQSKLNGVPTVRALFLSLVRNSALGVPNATTDARVGVRQACGCCYFSELGTVCADRCMSCERSRAEGPCWTRARRQWGRLLWVLREPAAVACRRAVR